MSFSLPPPCSFSYIGTLLTAELALRLGLACNTAGGTHHAQRDTGSGFCILNDLAATSISLLERGLVERVLIVDLDVHQVSPFLSPLFNLSAADRALLF